MPHVWQRRFHHGLQRPEIAAFGGDLEFGNCDDWLERRVARRPGGVELDPLGQRRELVIVELALGWHLGSVVLEVHCRDQQAVLRIAGHDRRAVFAAGQHRLARIEPQLGLLLVGPVAINALGDEERPDVVLEELDVLAGEFRGASFFSSAMIAAPGNKIAPVRAASTPSPVALAKCRIVLTMAGTECVRWEQIPGWWAHSIAQPTILTLIVDVGSKVTHVWIIHRPPLPATHSAVQKGRNRMWIVLYVVVGLAIALLLAIGLIFVTHVEDWSRDLTTNHAATSDDAPDERLRTIESSLPAERLVRTVIDSASRLPRWELIEEAREGESIRLHFVRTTGLVGYKDDIRVLIEPAGGGSRLSAREPISRRQGGPGAEPAESAGTPRSGAIGPIQNG